MTVTRIHIKKGHDLNVSGYPSSEMRVLPKPSHVGMIPERIPFIKPRLLVKVGDHVNIGSALFEDKRNPDIRFLSPGGGEVVDIRFGPRRVIASIGIKLDENEVYEPLTPVAPDDLETVQRENLVGRLLHAGLWPLLKALPFRDVPNPNSVPPMIFVSLDSREPFQPRPESYLTGKRREFELGLRVLRRLAGCTVCVTAEQENAPLLQAFKDVTALTYSGRYPAGDPGVLLYHTKTSSVENTSWYINGQDVLLIGRFLVDGRYPIDRTVVLGGSAAKAPMHVQTRMGVPLHHLNSSDAVENDLRYIVGGIFRGYTASMDSYLGFYETALVLLDEGAEREFLAFVRLGFHKPSYSGTFLSRFNPSNFSMDCRFHGSERACIGCGYCADVCPVDIFPQLALKSILAEDLEEALAHGLLDCVECGLCSYVCPSKIELLRTLKQAKADYYQELA